MQIHPNERPRPPGAVPAAEYVVEWGLRLDCEKQGCDPPHRDNGRVTDVSRTRPDHDLVINNHAATLVSRSIRYLPWVEAHTDGGGRANV